MKESQLQQQIISFLSAYSSKYNFVYFAPMNEGVSMVLSMFKIPAKTCAMIMGFMRKMGFLPGVSDIVILHMGQAYFLELKTKTGTQSKNQIRFMNNAKNVSCHYEIARSLGDCRKAMIKWNIITPVEKYNDGC